VGEASLLLSFLQDSPGHLKPIARIVRHNAAEVLDLIAEVLKTMIQELHVPAEHLAVLLCFRRELVDVHQLVLELTHVLMQ